MKWAWKRIGKHKWKFALLLINLLAMCTVILYPVWQPVWANDNTQLQVESPTLLCPDLLPPLHEWGPLCVATGTKAVQYRDIVALTWWDMPLVEGPAPDNFWAHIYIREGTWRVLEFGAMNHWRHYDGPIDEITLAYHDGLEWHALSENNVNLEPLEWVTLDYPNLVVWPGCELGVIFRIEETMHPRDLRLNLTLQRIATGEVVSGPVRTHEPRAERDLAW